MTYKYCLYLMSLREEIEEIMNDLCLEHDDSLTIIAVQKIMRKFEKRIDEMIGVDNQTINMKNGTREGKIAAQASKNTLTLVKEMLK